MESDFPVLIRRLGWLTSNVMKNILGRPPLCVLCIYNLPFFVKLQNIHENGINLLKRARFHKNAGIINSFQQGMADAFICNPKRECSDCTTD